MKKQATSAVVVAVRGVGSARLTRWMGHSDATEERTVSFARLKDWRLGEVLLGGHIDFDRRYEYSREREIRIRTSKGL